MSNRKKLDLGKLRAQRLEAEGARDFDVVINGKTFTLPYNNWIPLEKAVAIDASNSKLDMLRILLGNEVTDGLLAEGIDGGDFDAIAAEMQAGPSLGESSDSSES